MLYFRCANGPVQSRRSPTAKRPWSMLTFNSSLKGSSARIVSTADVITDSDCTGNLPPVIDLALYLQDRHGHGLRMSAQESSPIIH